MSMQTSISQTNGGIVRTPVTGWTDVIFGIDVDDDGKILAIGYGGTPVDIIISRYRANGLPDLSFGVNGIARVNLSGEEYGYSVHSAATGDIFVSGYSWIGGRPKFINSKIDSTGQIDSAFGAGGYTVLEGIKFDGYGLKSVLAPDLSVIQVGYGNTGNSSDIIITKYDSKGKPDNSFGIGGAVILDIAGGLGSWDYAFDLDLASDGKILVAGQTNAFDYINGDAIVVRLNPDGSLDKSFGASGIGFTNSMTRAVGIRSLPNGNIAVFGESYLGSDFAIFSPTGALLREFDSPLSVANINYHPAPIAIQQDGKILIGDYRSFSVRRYHPDGAFDDSFGSGGVVKIKVGDQEAIYSIDIQGDKILLGGTAVTSFSNGDFILVRLNMDGSLDSTFGVESHVSLRVTTSYWKENSPLNYSEINTNNGLFTKTDSDGKAEISGLIDDAAILEVSRTVSPEEASRTNLSVNLQDAVTILKMIAGQSANTGETPTSRFQSLAADYDGSGTVSLADALGVLRHSVGLQSQAPSWVFVEEPAESNSSILNPGTPGPIAVELSSGDPVQVNLIGVLRGDVDGSYGVYPG